MPVSYDGFVTGRQIIITGSIACASGKERRERIKGRKPELPYAIRMQKATNPQMAFI